MDKTVKVIKPQLPFVNWREKGEEDRIFFQTWLKSTGAEETVYAFLKKIGSDESDEETLLSSRLCMSPLLQTVQVLIYNRLFFMMCS